MIKHTSFLRTVKINNLLNINSVICFIAILFSTLLVNQQGIAQSLSCHGQLNISLNADCEYEVTPEVVSTVPLGTACTYSIMLTDHYDAPIVDAILNGTHLGQTIKVKLIDNCTSNSCWGSILVEDKMAPTIMCRDTAVTCLDMENYLPAVFDNCDPNPTVVQIGQTVTITDCGVGDDYIKKIQRTYQAEDHGGFRSEPCTQTITILRIDTLNFLNPVDLIEDNSFICGSDYPVDAEGHPHPDTTGIPFLLFPSLMDPQDTIPLFPNIKDVCKARLEYRDFVIGKDGCLTKIMREWSYIDACSAFDEIYVHTQAIWIRDTEAPKLACSHPITVVGNPIVGQNNAHGWGSGNTNCEFSVNIPPVTGTDNCSGIVRYEVLIDSVLVLTQNGGSVNIPADTFELMYVGFDGCGTPDTCVTELVVLDSAAPVAVCDRHSVIGLTQDGRVEVEAFVFDDGSFDDCGLQKMEVARMGDIICDTLDYNFGPTVTFCCSDVGQESMVAFRVWDFTGRHNTCMVTVEIQDKTGPNVDCPADQTIDCDYPINLSDLSEFGTAASNNQCETILNELEPIVDINSCNLGTITRKWSVSDIGGTDVCEQVITIENPFDFSFENLDSILLRPRDIDTSGACGLDLLPDNLPPGAQRPILLGSTCDLLGATYKDEVFVFDTGGDNTGGACLKILRNWTIINWCADHAERKLNVAQVIKVQNAIGPVITLGNNEDEVCTFDNDCTDGPITLTASATDDCSPRLRTFLILDAFNDGVIDDTLSTSVTYSGNTTISTITSTFPIGQHRVLFTFIDDCNNVSTREHIFTIKNCKAPTCALIDGLRVSLQVMDTDGDGNPDNEMACIWASDFDASSVGACTDSVTFFFNADQTMPEMCFSCCNQGSNSVDVYVFDQFGNHALCTTTVVVDDHNDVNFCNLTANCPQTDVTVSECGANIDPSILGQPSIGDGCACVNLSIPFDDVVTTTDDGCRLVTRTWDVSCSGDFVDNCVQRITVRNAVAPQIVDCPGHITMNIGGSTACEAFVNVRQPQVIDGCNDDVTISHNSDFADMQGANVSGTYPVGTTTITYTATNGCNRSSTCTLSITVRDNTAPVCNPRDITVTIRDDGEVTVGPGQLDNGSEDSCGDVFVAGSNMTFDCDDAGTTQPVVYFIEDESGNRIQCSANVTINDVSEPTCNTRNRTVSLGADGTATVNTTSLFDGGDGFCNNFDLEGSIITFDCDDAGTTTTVTYTITQRNGDSMDCTGTVTVRDEDRPECNSRDITVSLDNNGSVVVDPTTLQQGNNGGVCGDVNITGTPVTYDCCDAGTTQTVNYVINGSINCSAQVTIRNEAAPVCNSEDITVTLNANGVRDVNPRSLYAGNDGLCFDIGGSTNVRFDCDDAGTTQEVSYMLISACDDAITTCTGNVTITSEAQPVCDAEDITVSLDDNGVVTVDPTTLQQSGGTGVCGDVTITGDSVTYDCCDAGQTRTISYVINGTVNCSVSVSITAEADPVCNSNDITVSLNANGLLNVNPSSLYAGVEGKCFTLSSTNVQFDCDDAGTAQDVTYVLTSTCDGTALNCTATVNINPVEDVMISCPADVTVDCGTDISDLSVFGTATASDGCGGASMSPTEAVVSNLGVCGMGVITRTFTATNNNGDSEDCVQIITISGPSNPVTEADITWPRSPFPVIGCGGTAPVDGRPSVNTSNAECSNISMSSVDSDLTLNANTACEGNVVRTWTVIDSCQLDGSGAGIFTFEQVFEFRDDTDPVLNLPADVTVTATGDDCEANVVVNGISATDNCDPNPTITNDSPFADTNNSGNINGIYPVGTHVVNITVTDRCGNTTVESITITVEGQSSSFSFECKKNIYQIDDNQMVSVHIDTIVCINQTCAGSYTASFSRVNINDTVKVFTCSDVGAQNGFMSYIFLNGVLFDSCSTLQIVEDVFSNCSTPFVGSDVSGFIRTESGEGLKSAAIQLDGSEFATLSTDEDGFYAFPPVPNGGSYTVVPQKDDDHLNGVSTLDLIMIQKHILGLDLLDSPYKLIAADIDNSKSVSVSDIVELRKLILGYYDEFPDNTSWKAIDADVEFSDMSNPFASNLSEEYEILNIQSDMNVDFVGVKTGDVNASAVTVNGVSSEVRSNANLVFTVDEVKGYSGQTEYQFRSANYVDIEGFQFTVELPTNNSFVKVKSGLLDLQDENIGLRYISKGLFTISYGDVNAITSAEDDILFTIVLDQETSSNEPFVINSLITNAEAYGNEIYGVQYELENTQLSALTTMNQNNPNPWSNETQIEITVPKKMDATLTVYDIAGRVLYRVNDSFKSGINLVSLKKDDIKNYSGVAYYEFLSQDIKLVKSMIVIE